MVDRKKTGIEGLDELIQGGFPEESATLVTGGAGTGKTIFCSQFLWKGLQQGESGLFVTLEEEPDEIKKDAKEFGWDFEKYEKQGDFKLIYMNPLEGEGFIRKIEELITELDADRVVLDSISVMGMYTSDKGKVREELYSIIRKLRRSGVTSVITSEIPAERENALSRFGVEEFVADGVVKLTGLFLGEVTYRSLSIIKMRKTKIESDTNVLKITDNGLLVEPEDRL